MKIKKVYPSEEEVKRVPDVSAMLEEPYQYFINNIIPDFKEKAFKDSIIPEEHEVLIPMFGRDDRIEVRKCIVENDKVIYKCRFNGPEDFVVSEEYLKPTTITEDKYSTMLTNYMVGLGFKLYGDNPNKATVAVTLGYDKRLKCNRYSLCANFTLVF